MRPKRALPPRAAMADEVASFVKGVLQRSDHGTAAVQTKLLDRVRRREGASYLMRADPGA